MANEQESYLEQKIDANISKDKKYTYVFQKARLKLHDKLELQLLKDKDSILNKIIEVTEDEVRITYQPPEVFSSFHKIRNKPEHTRWLLAYQLVNKVKSHKLKRLIPVICPENIVFDAGYTPYLLHYGVKDSLLPYETNTEEIFRELKATVCVTVDGRHSFEEYLKYQETLKVSKDVDAIMKTASIEELFDLTSNKINDLEALEKTYVHIPNKKWKIQRYVLIGFILSFIPAFAYTLYSLVFLEPKQEAYVESQHAYLENSKSDVITILESYEPEDMPFIIKYQLADSYIKNVSLTEDQKKNVDNSITLQTDDNLLLYWIYIGRGLNEKALEIARPLEDRDLIMYALYNYSDEIKADEGLSSEKKEEKLDEIKNELEEYKQEIEQEQQEQEEKEREEREKEEARREKEEANRNQTSTQPNGNSTQNTTGKSEQPSTPAAGSNSTSTKKPTGSTN